MSERYQFVDMAQAGPDAVRTAFSNQVAYCRAAEAPVTARIVAAAASLLDKPATDFARQIAEWPGAPLADALPLRVAGGLHALHLAGAAPELSPIYANAEDINDAAIVAGVVRRHEAALLRVGSLCDLCSTCGASACGRIIAARQRGQAPEDDQRVLCGRIEEGRVIEVLGIEPVRVEDRNPGERRSAREPFGGILVWAVAPQEACLGKRGWRLRQFARAVCIDQDMAQHPGGRLRRNVRGAGAMLSGRPREATVRHRARSR